MKLCNSCGKKKKYNQFNYNGGGVRFECKDCQRIRAKLYLKTMDGVSQSIYNKQKSSSKVRLHPMPAHSLSEFREWLYSQPIFEKIYTDWVNSGYDKWLKPSCDRIDDYKPYTFDNIRIVTWGVNYHKYMSDKRNGINTKGCIGVIQYDLNMNYINDYYSIRFASRQTSVSQQAIKNSCNNTGKQGKYIWEYKVD